MIANTIVGAAALLLAVPVTLATPVIKPPCEEYKPFNAIGCYRDGNPRALPLQSNVDATTLTVEKCTASCKGNGFRYAGLEYGGECFCGNAIGGEKISDSECNMPCNGNQAQTCGGRLALSVWEDPVYPEPCKPVPPPPSSSSQPPPPPSSSSQPPPPPSSSSTRRPPPPSSSTTRPPPPPSSRSSTRTSSTPTSSQRPTPTGACKQPSNLFFKFWPGFPYCGVELPGVNCNTNPKPTDCTSACKAQYDECLSKNFLQCLIPGKKSPGIPGKPGFPGYRRGEAEAADEEQSENENYKRNLEPRTLDFFHKLKCKAQYDDCINQNKDTNPCGY